MESLIERAAFSQRLATALSKTAAGEKVGPTWLMREFNQRYQGPPVTIHAARKWMIGESLPMHDKLLALARWLKVSPEWLLYGVGEADGPSLLGQSSIGHSELDIELFSRIAALSSPHRRVISELVRVLTEIEHQ